MRKSPSRDLNTGPADYKSAALPTKPLRRHMILSVNSKKGGARPLSWLNCIVSFSCQRILSALPHVCIGLSKQIIRFGMDVLLHMAQLTVDIGGSPGINCRGFCEYCYFKKVKGVQPLGCRYCLPFKKGCDYCTRGMREEYAGFKDLRTIADETLANLQTKQGDIERITISGGGDPSCYPAFPDSSSSSAARKPRFISGIRAGKAGTIRRLPICSSTTDFPRSPLRSLPPTRNSGKSICMTRPRRPRSRFSNGSASAGVDVYAAAVVLPGSMTGRYWRRPARGSMTRGAKGMILMRFANTTEQGLILGNGPVMAKQNVQSVDSFRDMVTDLSKKFTMKISGTPLWDPRYRVAVCPP